MAIGNKISHAERIGILRAKLKEGNILRFMEAHNGLSGLIAGRASVIVEGRKRNTTVAFDGFWESSLTDSASKGLPDIEIVSMDSRLATIHQIMEVTDKPMIVDGDTGGDVNQFEYFVRRLESAGVSMVIIEDKVFPKRNSLEDDTKQDLENPRVFAEKIRAGQAAKLHKDFMIVARLEGLIAGVGMEDTVRRAETYLRAGADGIMIHSKREAPAEILEFARRFRKFPVALRRNKALVCVPTTYNTITEEELQRAGFHIVIYANHLLRASYRAMEEVCRSILSHGRSFEATPLCAPVKDLFREVGFLDIKEKDVAIAQRLKSLVRVIIPAAGKDALSETYGMPRSLLDINGKTLLERQMGMLKKTGLDNIVVITGYKGELFRQKSATYYRNPRYPKTHVAASLFMAASELSFPFISLYSDVLFNQHVASTAADLQSSGQDIVLLVDDAFRADRKQAGKHLDFVTTRHKKAEERRKLIDGFEEEVVAIGKKLPVEKADYEFIGIAYFSERGAEILRRVYRDSMASAGHRRFHEARTIETASLTDLVQEIIDRGYKVKIAKVYKGWMEVHSDEDLAAARRTFR